MVAVATPSKRHIIIVGGGIIGLAAALELADEAFQVTLLERGRVMEESSWAAAGMLAVEDPENTPALRELSRLSRALYPAFLARIAALTGQQISFRTDRTLQGRHAAGAGDPHPLLPTLRVDRYSFELLPEASLDPRDLCAALPGAAEAAGVQLREDAEVSGWQAHEEEVRVTLKGGETLACSRCILATGAWAGQLAAAEPLPVAPRKGQMIEVTLRSPELPMVIRTPELYLVPRGDGRIVIGATVEHAGFDRSIDRAAGERLWQAAGALWPPILEGRITARWTGLRPGFAPGVEDAMPVIGELSPGVLVATAHFRNGILLAPATARILRQLCIGEPSPIPLAPFAPERLLCALPRGAKP